MAHLKKKLKVGRFVIAFCEICLIVSQQLCMKRQVWSNLNILLIESRKGKIT